MQKINLAKCPQCRHCSSVSTNHQPIKKMKATDLIALATSKGYGISRTRSNHYQTHRVINGEHVTTNFFGKWADFVKHVKGL